MSRALDDALDRLARACESYSAFRKIAGDHTSDVVEEELPIAPTSAPTEAWKRTVREWPAGEPPQTTRSPGSPINPSMKTAETIREPVSVEPQVEEKTNLWLKIRGVANRFVRRYTPW